MVGILGIIINLIGVAFSSAQFSGGSPYLAFGAVIAAFLGGTCTYIALEDAEFCVWRLILFGNMALSGLMLIAMPLAALWAC